MISTRSIAAAELAIQLENVSVRYRLWEQGRPTLATLFQSHPARDFFALRELSLTVRRGEVLGLVGHNGAGKSTLLRVIARILPPQSGRVIVRGRISPLMELGAGMDPDLTGRENIYLKAAMLGRTRAETDARLERMIEFAGLREFMDQPLRTYSSGMSARLGFAIATDIEPDILLIDEVLAVGDAEFSKRSRERMDELRASGATVLIASHNSAALRGICDRVLWLAHGRAQMLGNAARVLNAYDRAASDWQAASEEDAARAELDATETFFALEFPHATFPEFETALETAFDAPHIAPARKLADIPSAPRQFLARYRLVRGEFFYDQISRLLQRPPITLTILRDPRAAPHENQYTRYLGARAPFDAKIPNDDLYLRSPLTRAEFLRACEVLENCAFIGLYEKPRESLLLLWHTFGWEPAAELPALVQSEQGGGDAALAQSRVWRVESASPDAEWDRALYEIAREFFDERFANMTRALGNVSELAQLHRALRENFSTRASQNGSARALRWHMDRAVSGRGWYNVEYNAQFGAYRWTGPEPRAHLQLPLPSALRAENLHLSCNLIFQELSPALTQLRVRVQDTPLAVTQSHAADGSLNLETEIPRALVQDRAFLQLALDVGETYLPKNGNFCDSRKLGVAVRWIQVSRYE